MNQTRKSKWPCHLAAALLAAGLLGASVAQSARPNGIDVSHWEGTINWTSVYNAGYVFAFTKATESINYTDPTLAYNMTNARNAGVLIGVFHFARPEYGNGATAEANYFVTVAGKYITNGYLRPVLDLETGTGLGKTALSAWVNTFNNRVLTLTGVKPMVYTGLDHAQNFLDSTVTNWPLWIAVWPANPDTQNGNPGTGVWPAWAFWQYTDKGTVPGITSATDLNVFNGVAAQLWDYVIGGNSNPPSITQHPANKSVVSGGSTTFTVGAAGGGTLAYQWQKNSNNIANGGHYSGVTTTTLVVTNADASDVASYRCIVTNAYGSATSSNATLTISTSCHPDPVVNASFESGSIGGVGDGWTGYQRAPFPTTSWSLQTASPPSGGGSKYQQIANTSSTGGGGVRQNINGCAIGATYTIAGWMRGNSGLATCTVKVSPAASTNWATAVSLNPPQAYTGSSWTAFSGTVVATASTMTLWLDGQTAGSSENKAECFDAITVTCSVPPPSPLRIASMTVTPQKQPRLTVTGPAGTNITIQRSSNFLDWSPMTNLTNPSGTVEFTDVGATNGLRWYYRARTP